MQPRVAAVAHLRLLPDFGARPHTVSHSTFPAALRSAGQSETWPGSHLVSLAYVVLAHPRLDLPVQASRNAVTKKCYFSVDVVKVSFYQIDYNEMFKTS